MTDTINSPSNSEILYKLKEDILDIIYYTECAFSWNLIQSIFICIYFRKTTSSQGMAWYRSFIVGFLLLYFPRLLYSTLINYSVDGYRYCDYFYIYSVVWMCINIFPFDLVFRTLNRKYFQIVLTILQTHIQGLVFTNDIYIISQFTENVQLQIIVLILISLSPLCVQGLDILLSGDDSRVLLTPLAFLKRILFLKIASVYLMVPTLFWEEPILDTVDVLYALPIILDILRIFDLYCFGFKNHMFIDYFSFSFLDNPSKFIPHFNKKSEKEKNISGDF